MSTIDRLKSFVEGKITLAELQKMMAQDKGMEEELRNSPVIPPYTSIGVDAFEYLLSLDGVDNDHCINAQDLLSQYLLMRGVKHSPSKIYQKIGDLKHRVQPKWVDVEFHIFGRILEEAGDRKGKDLISFLKERIAEIYKFESVPPKWLQHPDWPHRNGIPMKFLDQVKNDRMHDVAYDLHFIDEKTGERVKITQAM